MTTRKNTVLYTGASTDLYSRVYEHKKKINPGFTARYNVDKLVYYECFYEPDAGFTRETQIKSWSRKKKIELITSMNPEWKDLSSEIHNDRIDRYP